MKPSVKVTKKPDYASPVVKLRRVSQTMFTLLFMYLCFQTAFHPGNTSQKMVDFFFDADPLVLLSVWLGGHPIVPAMFFSLITVFVTLLLGRWFCGWFCPFGALHNFFSSLRRGTRKSKIMAGGYSTKQNIKYYVLAGLLLSALCGANQAGWLDPFSVLFRSLSMAVFPVVNAGVENLFDFIYRVDPGIGPVRLTAVSEPLYRWLRYNFLAVHQPHYFWSLFLMVLFVGVLALNFFRARFWCKYICPLGALLGIIGKNPLLRLNTSEKLCTGCKICLTDCQGAAEPNGPENWKPSECFYCMNCQSDCPTDAIDLHFQVPGTKHSAPPQLVNIPVWGLKNDD